MQKAKTYLKEAEVRIQSPCFQTKTFILWLTLAPHISYHDSSSCACPGFGAFHFERSQQRKTLRRALNPDLTPSRRTRRRRTAACSAGGS